MLFLHAALQGQKRLSTFKRQRQILDNLETDLFEKGVRRYYTAIKTVKQHRYAQHMGFELIGQHFDGTPFEVMAKDL